MKTVLKFLYVTICAVIAVVVYMYSYNTCGYNNINDLTQAAIKAGKYEDVGRIHGGCFDTVNLVKNSPNGAQVALYPSVTLNEVTYYTDTENDTTTTNYSFDKSYYIYVFESNLSDVDTSNNGVKTNPAAIRFTSTNGSYDYYFKVSSTVNTSSYIEKPTTVGDASLYSGRNLFDNITNYNFVCFTLTETMMAEMVKSTTCKGTITGFDIINTSGKSIFHTDNNLDFSQQFFKDVEELYTEYNLYIKTYKEAEAESDSEKAAAAKERFDAFYDGSETEAGFEAKFLQGTTYTFRYSDSVLKPKSLIWKAIGIDVLFVVCCALIYLILFEFKRIKKLLTGGYKKDVYRQNPGVSRRDAISAKAQVINKEKKNDDVIVIEEPKVEAAQEPKVEVVDEPKTEEVEETKTEE